MKDSEIISKLIYLAFINPPGEPVPPSGSGALLSWDDAMGVYGRQVQREAHLLPDGFAFRCPPAPDVIDTEKKITGKCETDDAFFSAVELLREHPDCGDQSNRKFLGKGGSEKQVIFDRLRAFRSVYGLGCLKEIADATGGMVSDDRIRDLINGGKADMEIWRTVGDALKKVSTVREAENAKS